MAEAVWKRVKVARFLGSYNGVTPLGARVLHCPFTYRALSSFAKFSKMLLVRKEIYLQGKLNVILFKILFSII